MVAAEVQSGVVLLMADDDPDDRLLAEDALASSRLVNDLRFVEDGQQLLDYLRREGDFAEPADAPRPNLILLDLNMPGIDGRQALKVIKADPKLRTIPVIVLTTSAAGDDIDTCYDLGASSYITKPVSFGGLLNALRTLEQFWFEYVELPPE